MMGTQSELGKSFLKLTQARNDAEQAELIRENDSDDSAMLDCYVVETDAQGDCTAKTELGKVELVRVNTVALHGSVSGDMQIYGNSVQAYKDAEGALWMDEQWHDEVFC